MAGSQLRRLTGLVFALALIPSSFVAASSLAHEIQKGDTLWRLAAKYHTSAKKIARANGLNEKTLLHLGKTIQIPTASTGAHLGNRFSKHHSVAATASSASAKRLPVGEKAQSVGHAGSRLIRTALACRGARYRSGGTSRGGFDCSGFTRYIFAKQGISLPHSSAAQAHTGSPVSKDELKQGDLVFFHTYRRGVSHVGIYIGGGRFIHAARYGRGVTVDSLSSSYYSGRYVGARRIR